MPKLTKECINMTDSASMLSSEQRLPEVVIYENDNFNPDGGWEFRLNLNVTKMSDYNDKISSIIVVSGSWEFYEHIDYGGDKLILGPGTYPSVEQIGIDQGKGHGWNDRISSFKAVAW